EEAVMAAGVGVIADDLATLIDAERFSALETRGVAVDGQGILNACVRATAKQKTVGARNVSVIPYDLADIVDAGPKRSKVGRGIIKGRVNAAAKEEAVEIIRAVGVVTDDLARVVDAECIGTESHGSHRIIESCLGIAVGVVEEAVMAAGV